MRAPVRDLCLVFGPEVGLWPGRWRFSCQRKWSVIGVRDGDVVIADRFRFYERKRPHDHGVRGEISVITGRARGLHSIARGLHSVARAALSTAEQACGRCRQPGGRLLT